MTQDRATVGIPGHPGAHARDGVFTFLATLISSCPSRRWKCPCFSQCFLYGPGKKQTQVLMDAFRKLSQVKKKGELISIWITADSWSLNIYIYIYIIIYIYMVELLPYTWASLEWMLVTMMPGAGYWIIRISRGLQELLRPAQGSNEGKHGKHLLIKSHKITPNLCQSSPKYLTNQTGLARKSPHLIEWLPIKTSIKCDLPYMFMIFLLFTRWVPSQPLLRLITDSTDPYIILYI